MCLLACEQGSVAGCAAGVRLERSWELSALPAKAVDEQTHVAVSLQTGKNHGGASQSQGMVLNAANCWLLCISPRASSSSLSCVRSPAGAGQSAPGLAGVPGNRSPHYSSTLKVAMSYLSPQTVFCQHSCLSLCTCNWYYVFKEECQFVRVVGKSRSLDFIFLCVLICM